MGCNILFQDKTIYISRHWVVQKPILAPTLLYYYWEPMNTVVSMKHWNFMATVMTIWVGTAFLDKKHVGTPPAKDSCFWCFSKKNMGHDYSSEMGNHKTAKLNTAARFWDMVWSAWCGGCIPGHCPNDLRNVPRGRWEISHVRAWPSKVNRASCKVKRI